jgi:hypothetical protein
MNIIRGTFTKLEKECAKIALLDESTLHITDIYDKYKHLLSQEERLAILKLVFLHKENNR